MTKLRAFIMGSMLMAVISGYMYLAWYLYH
jgi:hypothetical protein